MSGGTDNRLRADYTRVYRRGGKVAHLRENMWPASRILCYRRGRPWFYDADDPHWRGTGSQDEIDAAAKMSLCQACARATGTTPP